MWYNSCTILTQEDGVVDTHASAWFVNRDRRLGAKARTVLRDPNVCLIIPAIVLAEIKYLTHKGRLTQTLDEVLRVIGSDPRCTIYPIDLSVISKAPLGLDIHDSLIVGQIANLPYKLVPTRW